MTYKQITCAAKKMHTLLLDPGNEGVQDVIRRYRQECQLMASLRHPNITLFLGLFILEGSQLPVLVMERLEMSVDDLLECAPNIPLPVKLSILTDTCSGLVYLHGMTSPIVHRDLTAGNVLLNSSLSAKITDLGNSRIVNMQPGQLVKTLSKLPGTLVYMPPEALSDSHRYGPSLDVFSFGHLSLYNLTQVREIMQLIIIMIPIFLQNFWHDKTRVSGNLSNPASSHMSQYTPIELYEQLVTQKLFTSS